MKTKKKKGTKGQEGKEATLRSQSNPIDEGTTQPENQFETESNELSKTDGYMFSNSTLSATPKRSDTKKLAHGRQHTYLVHFNAFLTFF